MRASTGLILLLIGSLAAGCGHAKNETESSAAETDGRISTAPARPENARLMVCFKNPEILETIHKNGGKIGDSLLGQIQSLEALDLYEAKQARDPAQPAPPTVIVIGASESFEQYTSRIAERAQQYVSSLMDLIVFGQNSFQAPSDSIQSLPGVRSIDPVALSESLNPACATIAVASALGSGGRKVLAVDQGLFSHPLITKQSQAVILLHQYLAAASPEGRGPRAESVRHATELLITATPKTQIKTWVAFTDALKPKSAEPTLDAASEGLIELATQLAEYLSGYDSRTNYQHAHLELMTDISEAVKKHLLRCFPITKGGCERSLAESQDSRLRELSAKWSTFQSDRIQVFRKVAEERWQIMVHHSVIGHSTWARTTLDSASIQLQSFIWDVAHGMVAPVCFGPPADPTCYQGRSYDWDAHRLLAINLLKEFKASTTWPAQIDFGEEIAN